MDERNTLLFPKKGVAGIPKDYSGITLIAITAIYPTS